MQRSYVVGQKARMIPSLNSRVVGSEDAVVPPQQPKSRSNRGGNAGEHDQAQPRHLIIDAGMDQPEYADWHGCHAGRHDENAAGQVACGDCKNRQPCGG